jgi:hypothetical protein
VSAWCRHVEPDATGVRQYAKRVSRERRLQSLSKSGRTVADVTDIRFSSHARFAATLRCQWLRGLCMLSALLCFFGCGEFLFKRNPDLELIRQADTGTLSPAWSPDGTTLYFVLVSSGTRSGELRAMRSDGSGERLLFGGDCFCVSPFRTARNWRSLLRSKAATSQERCSCWTRRAR